MPESEDCRRLDFEQQALRCQEESERELDIKTIFKKGMKIKPLADALETAKVPRYNEVAAMCSDKVQGFEEEKRLGLSYVFAYTLESGTDEMYTDSPYWIINHALLNRETLSADSVQELIWGLLCGLRSLPYKRFETLYKGFKTCVSWSKEDMKVCDCFTSTTKERSIAESFLSVSSNGEKEGTLITIEGGWGYDLGEFGLAGKGNEVLMEPGMVIFVESIFPGSFIIVNAIVFVESENILLHDIPRSGKRDIVEVEEEKNDEEYSLAMGLKYVGYHKACLDILNSLSYREYRKGKMEYAVMAIFGDHRGKDRNEGFRLLKICEKYEDGRVFYALGVCHQMGYGTSKDLNVSLDYFIKSLLCGYPPAVHKCHEMKGFKTDAFEKNRKRYESVIERGRKGDGLCLGIHGCCLLHGLFEKQDLATGYELVRLSSEKKNSFGEDCLGDCYYYGWGVPKDLKKAFDCYKLSASRRNSNGQLKLARCYYNGEGTPKDLEKAVDIYKLSTQQDHPVSQYELGCCYVKGDGISQNLSKALQLFELAAEQGNAEAQHTLGVCYLNGDGVAKDLSKAFQLFKSAAEQGVPEAQYSLGYCYQFGKGVRQDSTAAKEWLGKAERQGNTRATTLLKKLP